MEQKEMQIVAPEGYEIDKEMSTFEKIIFKKSSQKKWRDNPSNKVNGFYINTYSDIVEEIYGMYASKNYNVFSTKKQAKSALAMARISQIMANDPRFGGIISDTEWADEDVDKYVINRYNNKIHKDWCCSSYHFLAFRTYEQRALFLEENEDLVKDYLMID